MFTRFYCNYGESIENTDMAAAILLYTVCALLTKSPLRLIHEIWGTPKVLIILPTSCPGAKIPEEGGLKQNESTMVCLCGQHASASLSVFLYGQNVELGTIQSWSLEDQGSFCC